MARPTGPTDEYAELRDVLIHIVCRWEVFWLHRSGARTADISRQLRFLYGHDVSFPTLKRQLDYLAAEDMITLADAPEYGETGTAWRSTDSGKDEWLQIMNDNRIPPVAPAVY